MANKGVKKEYKIKSALEKAGYHVTRAAGSHSDFDLIAIKGNKIRFIQLKYGSDNYLKYGFKKEEQSFIDKYPPGNYDVVFEFIKLKIGERFRAEY